MESKNEKFVRLANARIDNLVEQLRILSNLSHTSNYEYYEEQVELMFKRIEREVRKTKRAFKDGLEKFKEKELQK